MFSKLGFKAQKKSPILDKQSPNIETNFLVFWMASFQTNDVFGGNEILIKMIHIP